MIELPGTFVEMPLNEVGECSKFYYDRSHGLCVILLDAEKKTWTVSHGNPYNHSDIYGMTNGYCLMARHVCYVLCRLGLWTREEAQAFNEQQWHTDRTYIEKAKIEEATNLLRNAGFEVI
jgi:hypothetical protein